jgi:hypothetical protein
MEKTIFYRSGTLKENLIELSRTAILSPKKGETSQVECPPGLLLTIFYP